MLVAAVEYDTLQDARLAWLGVPAVVLGALFFRREARLTRLSADPLVDLRLFRVPSYTVGVLLALVFFCGMTGLPLVLALYYQQGLGYTALESGIGVTAYALGSAVAAPLAGRVVTRIGRPLVVGGCFAFGFGALLLDLVARQGPDNAALAFALPLFVIGRRLRRRDHAEPDPVPGGGRPGHRQHRRRRAADRSADRLGDRAGRDRRDVLRGAPAAAAAGSLTEAERADGVRRMPSDRRSLVTLVLRRRGPAPGDRRSGRHEAAGAVRRAA